MWASVLVTSGSQYIRRSCPLVRTVLCRRLLHTRAVPADEMPPAGGATVLCLEGLPDEDIAQAVKLAAPRGDTTLYFDVPSCRATSKAVLDTYGLVYGQLARDAPRCNMVPLVAHSDWNPGAPLLRAVSCQQADWWSPHTCCFDPARCTCH